MSFKPITKNFKYLLKGNNLLIQKQIKYNDSKNSINISNSTNLIKTKNKLIDNQKIIFIKSNIILDLNEKIYNPEIETNIIIKKNLLNKKILHITPGGLFGFYDTAICKYIKDKYNLKNWIFNGASAGSWNSLLMVYKHDHNRLINIIFNNFRQHRIKDIKSIQQDFKNIILSNSSTKDFELDKLFITVCVWDNNKINNYVYTDFESLESAIDCCIASSNIPILTGDIVYKYKNKISYDGGFLKKSNILIKEPEFTLTNTIFGKKRFFMSQFDTNKDIIELYNEGLNDCINNSYHLDRIFIKKSFRYRLRNHKNIIF
jgi:hypothetical protein